MHPDPLRFWYRWLLAVVWLLISFGLALAFLNGTPLLAPILRPIDGAFWRTDAITPAIRSFQHWVYGVLGAMLVGWGSPLGFVIVAAFRTRQSWVRNALAASLLLWFMTDTAISLYFHVFINALLNVVILVGALLPVGMTWQSFREMRVD